MGANLDPDTAAAKSVRWREAIGANLKGRRLSGHVEIGRAYFGGYVRPENRKDEWKDCRLTIRQTGKRRAIAVMRERSAGVFSGRDIYWQRTAN